ncbi:MAG: helix-turn-helix domain-containing protein [Myxococcota bacterium]
MKKTLGIRLRNRRQELKLTQDEVATRAGFSSKYISEIERGCRDMPLSTLCRIVEQGLEWRVDEAVFGLTSQTEINANEAPVSPLVQKLALELSALPDEKQSEVVQLLSGITRLVDGALPPRLSVTA